MENIHENIVNTPATRNPRKLGERKPALRMKANALGDVQNTLHLRPAGFVNQNTNPVKPKESKQFNKPKPAKDDKTKLKRDFSNVKEINVAKEEAVKSTSVNDENNFDFHNHFLCEQANEAIENKFFSENNMTEKEIDSFVKSLKTFKLELPYNYEPFLPFESLQIQPKKSCKDTNFSVNDVLEDLIYHDVP